VAATGCRLAAGAPSRREKGLDFGTFSLEHWTHAMGGTKASGRIGQLSI